MKMTDEYDILKTTGVYNEYVRIRIIGKLMALDELGIVVGLGRSRDLNGNALREWEITEPVSGLRIVRGRSVAVALKELHELKENQIEYVQRIQEEGVCEAPAGRKIVSYRRAPELR